MEPVVLSDSFLKLGVFVRRIPGTLGQAFPPFVFAQDDEFGIGGIGAIQPCVRLAIVRFNQQVKQRKQVAAITVGKLQ